MIDWKLAGTVARGVANMQPAGNPEPFEQLAEPAAEAERLVSAYTGLVAPATPPAEAVERPAWIDANLASLQIVMEPAVGRIGGKLGPLGVIAGSVMAVEAGAISGFLAGRVLGQYEFPVLEPDKPARLLFVAPNLAQAATSLDAPADQLLRWVALHEMTHALQFGGVPWLREHLASMLRELLGALEMDPRSLLRVPDLTDLRAAFERVREDGLATVMVGADKRETLDRVQAFMAVLEGYAEHVMDAVGADVLDDLPALRSALQRRRRDRSGLLKILERLIGMDLKLRQYEQGKAFCDAVVARAGIDGLNRVWSAPEAMPSVAELDDAVGWLARTERVEPAF
ncbi:zinc-dependent metalloprotease [Solirubrobacter sp. CPCC 204708]|uniref:Zinc-dependent metalloprotease n=1 Tax=Solirubrobacter deserti TaxID=2282478 RepID=A0ABT4RBI5_9ACTN|nr:zinc-dependent metalloprotease [Solirubrobacter deserti]MBE2317205.1 zinc-dependent metalloprotease [Solirubrobacter deserti]MDA0135902.1 zinc-dependent metalloprotease [Solirubrobacter deserti]